MTARTREMLLLFFAACAAILAVPFALLIQGWL